MKKSKSIVFVNQSSGYLMIDIINQQVPDFEEVVLITGMLNPRNTTLHPKVKVRLITKYNRSSSLKRMWSWLVFTIQSFFLIFIHYRKSYVYMVSNPPIGVFLMTFLSNKVTYLIYDVYPDTLVNYNLLSSSSILYKAWVKVNRKVYQKAENIYTISFGMKNLLAEYVKDERIKVVPVWTDNDFLKPIIKTKNTFIKDKNLENLFIIMYSGNIGRTHPVEVLLNIAEQLSNYPIKIVIIGEGEKKKSLISIKENKQLRNVLFLPFQDMEVFPYSLAAADLAVVTLGKKASELSVPSKTFNIMSVGVPVLAISGDSSELAQIVRKNRMGGSFEEEDISGMVEFIKLLINNKPDYLNYCRNSLNASLQYTKKKNVVDLKF